MTMRDLPLPAQLPLGQPSGSAPANCVSSLGSRIAEWFATAADYYAAAALYDQLSGLSDVELHRRGLSRATLGWDIVQACDRAPVSEAKSG